MLYFFVTHLHKSLQLAGKLNSTHSTFRKLETILAMLIICTVHQAKILTDAGPPEDYVFGDPQWPDIKQQW